MSGKINLVLVAGAIVLAVVAGHLLYQWGYSSGYSECENDHAASALAVQKKNERLAQRIREQESTKAELVKQNLDLERQRIDAIDLKDAAAERVAELQRQLDASGPVDTSDRFIVSRRGYLERVWKDINSSDGRAEEGITGPVQARLPALSLNPGRTDWSSGGNGGRYRCDSKKCCKAIPDVPERIRRAFVSL